MPAPRVNSVSAATDTWTAPLSCDQCAHPISEHTIWPPDATCGGWMHCRADGCDQCWHDWPKVNTSE
jgi:hypothetical protein